MIRALVTCLLSAILAGCASGAVRERPTLLEASGCSLLADPSRSAFVLHEVNSGRTLVCNAERARTRFTPASTFKIAHALIALETGVVEDETAPFVWDGRPRGVAAWDQDTSLAGALAPSTVWVFQTLATRIGIEREQAWLSRLDYGNVAAGGPETLRTFWLSGPLSISAVEQIEFVGRLRSGALPSSPVAQRRVREMLRLRDCGADCRIYGKTGAVLPIDENGFLRPGTRELLPPGERTGWFVGWVERGAEAGGPVIFAHNLDLELPNAMAARTRIAYALLAANGIEIEEP